MGGTGGTAQGPSSAPPAGDVRAVPDSGPGLRTPGLARCGNATAQSGLITGGGADLLYDRRSAGTSHLDTARPDQSTTPATTPLKGDAG